MKRGLWLVLFVALLGCRQRQMTSAVDPFTFGRTTVPPPPATMAVPSGTIQPWNPNATTVPALGAPPGTYAPGAAGTTLPASPYAAPPGYGYPAGTTASPYTAPPYTAPGYSAPGATAPGYTNPGYSAPAGSYPPVTAPLPSGTQPAPYTGSEWGPAESGVRFAGGTVDSSRLMPVSATQIANSIPPLTELGRAPLRTTDISNLPPTR